MFPNGPLHTHIDLSAVQAEFQREIDILKDELHTHTFKQCKQNFSMKLAH